MAAPAAISVSVIIPAAICILLYVPVTSHQNEAPVQSFALNETQSVKVSTHETSEEAVGIFVRFPQCIKACQLV